MFRLLVLSVSFAFAASLSLHKHETNRIIGGNEAKISTYPFAASVSIFQAHVCGGAVVNANYIVTAAQCLYLSYIKAGSVSVRAGLENLAHGGLIQYPKQILFHPSFNYRTFDCDISFLKITERISGPSNGVVKPIPIVSVQDRPKHGEILTAIGWGQTSEDNHGKLGILRFVTVPTIDAELCRSVYSPIKINITENMFCAGGSGYRATWKADNGGPVINQQNQLVGLVSWRAVKLLKGYPSVFTSLSSEEIRKFIKPLL